MKRRDLLRVGATGAALSIWPTWLARAFDPDAACAGAAQSEELLFDAYRVARREKKPLLVLVIPADDAAKYERGELLGELLNCGDDETLASLSRVQLVCATLEDVSHLVELDPAGDALFVTIDTAARPARVRRWADESGEPPAPDPALDYEAREAAIDRFIDERIVRLGALLQSAVAEATHGTVSGADYRAESAARTLLEGAPIEAPVVLRVAAALHERAHSVASERTKLIAGLAAAVRAEVIAKRVPGSRWGHSFGCGTSFEDVAPEDTVRYGCGMGHVSAKSERFLYLFTRLPWEEP